MDTRVINYSFWTPIPRRRESLTYYRYRH